MKLTLQNHYQTVSPKSKHFFCQVQPFAVSLCNMAPTLHPSDVAAVEPIDVIESGGVYCLYSELFGVTYRRIFRSDDGMMILANDAHQETQIMSEKAVLNLIIGRTIGAFTKFGFC